jgi:predicted enzyme related to lactoylglutathione lyase
MTSFHGRFVWYELLTSDLPAAEAFYRGVLGWDAQDPGMPDMRYTIFMASGMRAAGGMAMPEAGVKNGMKPHWLGYVGVDDVDGSAANIAEAGGAVHHAPEDIPHVGRFAVVADPQGAVFALFKPLPGTEAPEPAPFTPGHGGWRELLAADAPAIFDFYAHQFGWTKGDPIDMGPMGVYQIINRGDQMMGGMMTKPPAMPKPFWLYYFNIDGIEGAKMRVAAGGGQVLHGPQQVPGGSWILQCVDPQGAHFALVGPMG